MILPHHQPGFHARRLASFRDLRSDPPIPTLERWLVGILAFHLAFLPWPLATMHSVPQIISLLVSVAGLGVAVSRSGRNIVRFPLFWIGIALLAYVAIQALNPNWEYFTDGHRWWLAAKNNVSWLPPGVQAPWQPMNTWRQGSILCDAWLFASSVWIGITRRKSLQVLCGAVAATCLFLTALLTVQITGPGARFPWPLTDWTPYALTASFVSRNHAGAYFVLGTACAAALFVACLDKSERLLRKSSPAGIWGVAAVVTSGGVLFTLSRGAVVTLALFYLVLISWFVARRKRRQNHGRADRKIKAAIAALSFLALVVTVDSLDFSQLASRFGQLAGFDRSPDVRLRIEARHAAVEMLADHWGAGVGAGAFRYLFVTYARRHPAICNLFWEHAHCDWIELPIEMGLVGDLLVLLSAGWIGLYLVKRKFWTSGVAPPLLIGCSQTLVHAWFDFPFQCPAILVTWCFMLIASAKWLSLSESKSAA